jgi:hypothetical protein
VTGTDELIHPQALVHRLHAAPLIADEFAFCRPFECTQTTRRPNLKARARLDAANKQRQACERLGPRGRRAALSVEALTEYDCEQQLRATSGARQSRPAIRWSCCMDDRRQLPVIKPFAQLALPGRAAVDRRDQRQPIDQAMLGKWSVGVQQATRIAQPGGATFGSDMQVGAIR